MIALNRGKRWIDEAAMRVYQHPGGADPNCVQHSDQECGFIFAVAIAIPEDVGSRMRLQSTDADLYAHVANLPLHKAANALDPGFEVGRTANFASLRGDLLRSFGAARRKGVVPIANLRPTFIAGRQSCGRVVDYHAGSQGRG